MWYRIGQFILKYRLAALLLLLSLTGIMGYYASQVSLSYDFTRAVPKDNPRMLDYQAFLNKFGADGNTMVIGIESNQFFTKDLFNAVRKLHQQLKKVSGVTGVLSIPEVVTLANDSLTQKLGPVKIFHYPYNSQSALDSDRALFEALPFYQSLLYNPTSHAYLMGISVNKDTINSKSRTRLIDDIIKEVNSFEKENQVSVYRSGMPYIRTVMANRIKKEIN